MCVCVCVCVWECVCERERERERERSVSGLWSLTPCFAPACGLQESLYLTLHVVHTHTHGALCQLCTQPGPNLPEHPLKETFSALFLDTRRVCVNSAGFSFSFHDREVFLTHFWLNIAHRNTLSPEQHSYHLVKLKGYVCLSTCGCANIWWSVITLGVISLKLTDMDFLASLC